MPDGSTPVKAPTTIGRYTIVERVGRGGMGVLYRGHDPDLERDVAIKVMSADLSGDADAQVRFSREAKAAARLQHRNIVTVYEFGDADGNPYIAMEFLKGQSLASRMRTEPSLSTDAILDIVVQLCTGLHHAHSAGVVHRDVKPANVWMQPDGTVKLLDFGIARLASSSTTKGKDSPGSVSYMAPERFGSGPVDSRADIFAVGVVLYELLAGKKPFEGDSPTVIAHKILQEPPPPLAAIAPRAPKALVAIVDRALKKAPDDRYATAGDMAADIELSRRPPPPAPAPPVRKKAESSTVVDHFRFDEPIRDIDDASTGLDGWRNWLTTTRGGRAAIAATAGVAVVAVILLAIRPWSTPVRSTRDKAPEAEKLSSPQPPPPRPPVEPPTTATITVESVPPGATVSVNGTSITAVTPTSITVTRQAATRLRLTKTGFAPSDTSVTAEAILSGKIVLRLEPVRLDPVTISASGPYPFEILEGTRLLSPASETHELRLVGKRTLRLSAPAVYLDQYVTVDPAVRQQWSVEAPETGTMRIYAGDALGQCRAFVGTTDLDLGPWNPLFLVPNTYKVRLDCPDGKLRQQIHTVQAGELKQVKFQ